MSMTSEERRAKAYLSRLLKTNGYPTYAKILDRFDVNYTNDPEVIAYMIPGEGVIVMNRGLDAKQASVIVRHEILHEYLKHEKRLLDSLARKKGLNRNELMGTELEDLDSKLKRELYADDTFNYAADYEISNRGYTEKDKNDIRALQINGRIVSGLVTEDQHPDWMELSVEEMYDKLVDIRNKEWEEAMKQPIPAVFVDNTTMMDPFTGVRYGLEE